ncbi:outer membrane beta-barrel protein [Legionella oakridgensis]|uniref:Opacity protein-related surface antigens n=2 Tax=Legionella oakridgensis TaxID=29423 RepID=W0BE65_9GAMM|nr:outer membrane beta-barrel protein [Legionella oakridgensis]AHE66912.1 opacity protein-related surface antigens [Legionella oakridgensis ATCC 33761 = DSM 21215]ETO93416.1 opacity protein [Legionella oakridgensis RV-2-2007]KTD37160.1 OmpA-like transmembrane domain protein [Legionella oakridgensis]STY20018.1 Opacity protein and related surface antigens [Legionella longbeachae]
MINIKWKPLTLACVGTCLAINVHASSRDGLYFGAGIGAAFDQFDLTTKNIINGFTVKSPMNEKTSAVGNVFVGYGGTADSGFYLAGELGTYFPSRSATNYGRPGVFITASTFTDTMRVQDYATIDALPGYRLNEAWLLYGRAGLTYAHFELNQAATALVPAFNSSENKWGGRIGAGLNFAFNSNLGIGLDYFYTHYPKVNTTAGAFNTSFTQQVCSNYVGISALYTI